MNRIALLTSGGDAPGMNAAIRSVVRMAIQQGFDVEGIHCGYQGLIEGKLHPMHARTVSNIIHRGGTILKTARSKEFQTEEGLEKAAAVLTEHAIDGLVVIGGNGTFKGAIELSQKWKGKIIGLPGTIDNDLYGTDSTIGYETAVYTAVENIDKIRDTAESHDRTFFVEVMGRHSGFIALSVGVACGAEVVILPDEQHSLKTISDHLKAGQERGKSSGIVIVAEGCKLGNAEAVAKALESDYGYPYRVVVLGHIQRGGAPIPYDRILASKLGAFAVESLVKGAHLQLAGEINNQPTLTPMEEAISKKKPLDPYIQKIFYALTL